MVKEIKRVIAEKVIIFVHPDLEQLKSYLNIISDALSSEYVLATANSFEMIQSLIEQHLSIDNEILLCVGTDELLNVDEIELMNLIQRKSPKTRQIMILSKLNADMDLYDKGEYQLERVFQAPFNESDFVSTVKSVIKTIELESEIEKLKKKEIDDTHHIEERIEAGIKDATNRKSFLESLVQARLSYLDELIKLLSNNTIYLDEIIDFFESLKTQMSSKEKSRLAPGFYQIRNSINELSDWNKNIKNTFIVNTTDFNLKYIFLQEMRKVQSHFQKLDIHILEDIDTEIRVHADYHMVISTIKSIIKLFLNIGVQGGKFSVISKVNGTYIDTYFQNNGDQYSKEEILSMLKKETMTDNNLLANDYLQWSVIQEFVSLNDGTINVEKHRGATQIIISLHASKMYLTMLSAIKNSKPKYDLSNIKVLLVDDTDINLMIMLRQLTQFGVSITTCSNGFEAIQQAQKIRYDYIFMDLVMPKLDGYAAAKIINDHQNRMGAHPKVIFQTSHSKMISKAKMKDAGGDRIILKPLKNNVLEDIFWEHIKDAIPLSEMTGL